jgi:hypothetical protein
MLLVGGCATGRAVSGDSLTPKPQMDRATPWEPIAPSEVGRDDFARTLDGILRVTGPNTLWPGFTLDDHGVILVDNRHPQTPEVVCIGSCVPGKRSRLWKMRGAARAPRALTFASGHDWGLPQQTDVVVALFESSDISVSVVLHEDFHLTFQRLYGDKHPHALDPPNGVTSAFTREKLEHSYVANPLTLQDLRAECTALTSAFRAVDGETARAELRRFVTLRDARRAAPHAPLFEEDYWERLEGVPTNVERRIAERLHFRDTSVIQSALDSGCDTVGPVAYFIVLGGLQAALLDRYEPSWPSAVYPEHGLAASLFELLRKHAAPTRERNSP